MDYLKWTKQYAYKICERGRKTVQRSEKEPGYDFVNAVHKYLNAETTQMRKCT